MSSGVLIDRHGAKGGDDVMLHTPGVTLQGLGAEPRSRRFEPGVGNVFDAGTRCSRLGVLGRHEKLLQLELRLAFGALDPWSISTAARSPDPWGSLS